MFLNAFLFQTLTSCFTAASFFINFILPDIAEIHYSSNPREPFWDICA